MHLGIVGMGRMGANMTRRLLAGGHHIVAYDRTPAHAEALAAFGATPVSSIAALVSALEQPRAVWIMLPAGAPTEEMIERLAALLSPGDILIDGGNSFWHDDVRRAGFLAQKGLAYLDVGVSGGVWGLERGYCLMIGGEAEIVARLDPVFATLAPGPGDIPRTAGRNAGDPRAERGYLHVGPAGAGHFVKMVHNGVEYGLMQAYAEGFDILRSVAGEGVPQERRYDLNVADIAELWRRGSVVSSWLLDLAAAALARNPSLSDFEGRVADSGEGRWAVNAAVEEAVPAPVLTAALFARFRSRVAHTFGEKLLSAMRAGFGAHPEAPPPRQDGGSS